MPHIVIIGTVFPEPNSTAAGTRMCQLISLFRAMNWKISFLCAATETPHSADLQEWGVACFSIELNNNSFDEKIEKLSPDVVLYDRFLTEEQYGWRVSQVLPHALTILDTEDLHFLRKSREEAYKKREEYQVENCVYSSYFSREMASIIRCDLSLIISDFEYKLLTERFQISPDILHYIPLFGGVHRSSVGYFERKNFLSIGNFLHDPNWQTVLLLKKYWQNIRKRLPEAELHIYGAYTPQKAEQLDNVKEGFLIKGRAGDLAETFQQYRAMLAPIPFGAGIKGKMLDAMQYGLPSITTPMGAEGMQVNEKWNGYIANDEADFVEKTVTLYTQPMLWQEAVERGYDIVEQKFSQVHFEEGFREKIEYLLSGIQGHRERQYLGIVLRHHFLQSTRYMSKWIEEKERRFLL